MFHLNLMVHKPELKQNRNLFKSNLSTFIGKFYQNLIDYILEEKLFDEFIFLYAAIYTSS